MNFILNAFLKWNADSSSNETHVLYIVHLIVDERLVFPEGLRQNPYESNLHQVARSLERLKAFVKMRNMTMFLFQFYFPLKILL